MKKIFTNFPKIEELAKKEFSIPPFLMMENAANFTANFIVEKRIKKAIILCGKGNNGGDGFAISRLLRSYDENFDVTLLAPELPAAQEAKTQFEICKKLKIPAKTEAQVLPFLEKIFCNAKKNHEDFQATRYSVCENLKSQENFQNVDDDFSDFSNFSDFPENKIAIVDCLFGTGFHGELSPERKRIFDVLNSIKSLKIACDVPSALYFDADFTIAMGALKTQLFSDTAKNVCGKIILANLGIPSRIFESFSGPDAFLLEKSDLRLPFRTQKSAHKGTYGHACVFACQKSGAGIIAATAAMNFGSGLTSLLQTDFSNLSQFKISPELMICKTIPQKTTAVLFGSGFSGSAIPNFIFSSIISWAETTKNPGIVLDAGVFDCDNFCSFLQNLRKIQNVKIALTPHLSEFSRMIFKIKEEILKSRNPEDFPFCDDDFSVKTLAENAEQKISVIKYFANLYPNVTLVVKSANTFIATENQIFICDGGAQNLAKGGSGDVLAGMIASLLAQGFSAKQAALNATLAHAAASEKAGAESFNLTPEKLISLL